MEKVRSLDIMNRSLSLRLYIFLNLAADAMPSLCASNGVLCGLGSLTVSSQSQGHPCFGWPRLVTLAILNRSCIKVSLVQKAPLRPP